MWTMVGLSGVLLVLFVQTVTARPAKTQPEPEHPVRNEERLGLSGHQTILMMESSEEYQDDPAQTRPESEQPVMNDDLPDPSGRWGVSWSASLSASVMSWSRSWSWSYSIGWDDPGSPEAQVVCGKSQIQIGLQLSTLGSYGLDGSSAHLVDRPCSHSTEHDGTVWYRVARRANACGNTLTTNSTHAIYSNTLFVYPANDDASEYAASFHFSCVYPLDTETGQNVASVPTGRSVAG